MYTYARDNLAVVNIYIKDAVVTKIRRDQKVPIIWFVANLGGILGLCMGFSLITIFEIGQYLMQATIAKVKCSSKDTRATRVRKNYEYPHSAEIQAFFCHLDFS